MQLSRLKPGLRLEVRRLLETENTETRTPIWLVSQLLDRLTDDYIIIAAPTDAFHIVEWPLGSKLEVAFVQPQHGLWKFKVKICDCGVMDHIIFYRVKIVSRLERHQRRSFYRLDCMLDVEWQLTDRCKKCGESNISREPYKVQYDKKVTNEVPTEMQSADIISRIEPFKHSMAVNISGGGVRFVGDKLLPLKTQLIVRVYFENREIQTIGEVINCENKKQGRDNQYLVAIKFTKISQADQDMLIQYIFKCQKLRLENKF